MRASNRGQRTPARLGLAFAVAATVLSISASGVFAGEVTGNGKLLDMHGRSSCAFSGQEDLQYFTDNGDGTPRTDPTKGDPSHAQSWGQIPQDVRAYLTSIGMNPGIACNPTRSTGEG